MPQVLETKAHKTELIQIIDLLSDKATLQVKGYAERLREEEQEEIDAEIAELEAKYGTTPNAETREALAELRAGKGEEVTIDQIIAELNAEN